MTQREAELSAQIEILDSEINEITAARNEELQRARVRIEETSAAFTARKKEQKAQIERYNEEIEKRESQYSEQLKAIEHQKELERVQFETQIQSTNEKLQQVQILYNKMEKRNAQEINTLKQDIERLKESLEGAKQRELEQIEDARTQIIKTQEALNDNLAIEEEIASVKKEIEQIKKDNIEMRKERQRLDTMIYNSRMSQHKSTFK
ncbi:hypothetical protein TRFO_42414 [Tritrichomonas foetus]|uniref:Kinetoplast-associated protein n=1 Tax=Tritrichomonas foetus TaxID=1144522 RepID=A0A1J4L112_9EUKA|nr:hypothetical protein TRFO_42414 [Tritrichomonas foetus]|eukprot:OHT15654.1 hypothetical protein TRFO_42414 [Tritrichomonas foetus]